MSFVESRSGLEHPKMTVDTLIVKRPARVKIGNVDYDYCSRLSKRHSVVYFSEGDTRRIMLSRLAAPLGSIKDAHKNVLFNIDLWDRSKSKQGMTSVNTAIEELVNNVATSALQVIARRVGLEKVDYKNILVEKYGCHPVTLGEVRMVNGYLDVEGSIDFSREKLTKLPFKFGKVGGNFYCDGNNLTSLEGAPREVGGDFFCDYNKLTSLKGAPLKVGGDFNCNNNKLTSLDGAPLEVGGSFWCYNNQLDDAEKPAGVKGRFLK